MSAGNKNSAGSHEAETLSPTAYFQQLLNLIPQLPFQAVDGIVRVILEAYEQDRTVFVFGNGGSAASASHMMVDMNKGAAETPGARRLKVMALTDNVPVLTAWAN